jgi:hypothetical protein
MQRTDRAFLQPGGLGDPALVFPSPMALRECTAIASARNRAASGTSSRGRAGIGSVECIGRRGHRQLRAQWSRRVEAGAVECARCGELILLGETWDLDHRDDRRGYLGPSHARSNRATSSHRVEREGWFDPTSRIW